MSKDRSKPAREKRKPKKAKVSAPKESRGSDAAAHIAQHDL